jgi:hypothetical protein
LIEIVLAAMDSTSEPSRLAYLCISVIEAFLGWNFSNETQLFQSDANIASGSGNGSENSGGSITLRLPQQFGATIINPNFLALFFRVGKPSGNNLPTKKMIKNRLFDHPLGMTRWNIKSNSAWFN